MKSIGVPSSSSSDAATVGIRRTVVDVAEGGGAVDGGDGFGVEERELRRAARDVEVGGGGDEARDDDARGLERELARCRAFCVGVVDRGGVVGARAGGEPRDRE